MAGESVAIRSEIESVTFLFTDIEGSSRLWEAEPERMAVALARHDELCQSAVASHDGRLVKMTGDGLYAVFDDPAAAVATALMLQRGIGAIATDCRLELRMRSGLHAGVSQVRNGDYFGSAVNRAARIMSAAHGGQILLSQAVVDQGKARLRADVDLLHLGRVRLRDLSEPEEVWQVLHGDLQPTFPALRSLVEAPNNLPQQLSSFIGREKQIAEIKTLLTTTRLLTLTGSGGCGKTRLAVQVASNLLESFPDGIWLAEFAALADPGLVPGAVVSILGLRQSSSVTQTLIEHLRSRQLLLVLDNCEHLIYACAALAEMLLRQCPRVVVLATSRQALDIDGECPYRVPSLSMPDPNQDVTPESLSRYESTCLFTERARLQQSGFVVNERNARALASICHRLDGIPLAIELAASRMRSMSVEEIDRHIDQRFQLLTARSSTAPPRQQTLRALIDWSYDLLSNVEKLMFQRVSIFAGGWTIAATEQVCADDLINPGEVLDLLCSLVDRSLVMTDTEGDETRYRMPETIGHYARDRLRESGMEGHMQARHLAYCLVLAEQSERVKLTAAQRESVVKLKTERANLRAALSRAAASGGDLEGGLRLASSLAWYWRIHESDTEGRASFSALLAAAPTDLDKAVRTKALSEAAFFAYGQGDYADAKVLRQECLAIGTELKDRRIVAQSLSGLGAIAAKQGDHQSAQTLYDEALAIRRELGDRADIQNSLLWIGYSAVERGDYAAARAALEESLAICRDRGWQTAEALSMLGDAAYLQGDYSAAREQYEESLAISRELDLKPFIVDALTSLGTLAHDEGDDRNARSLLSEALILDVEFRNVGSPGTLEGLAMIAIAVAGPDVAARIFGGAQRLREDLGSPPAPTERALYEQRIAAARAASGNNAAFDRAWHEGRTMPREEIAEYALHF